MITVSAIVNKILRSKFRSTNNCVNALTTKFCQQKTINLWDTKTVSLNCLCSVLQQPIPNYVALYFKLFLCNVSTNEYHDIYFSPGGTGIASSKVPERTKTKVLLHFCFLPPSTDVGRFYCCQGSRYIENRSYSNVLLRSKDHAP